MGIDLSKFKVIYDDKVLRALSLQNVTFLDDTDWDAVSKKPKTIEIMAINEDGNIEVLKDEAWMFQFIPILNN